MILGNIGWGKIDCRIDDVFHVSYVTINIRMFNNNICIASNINMILPEFRTEIIAGRPGFIILNIRYKPSVRDITSTPACIITIIIK